MPLQTCKGCKQTKTANDFYRNRTNADGLFGKCKLCSDKQADANRRPRVRHNVTEPTVDSKVRVGIRVWGMDWNPVTNLG